MPGRGGVREVAFSEFAARLDAGTRRIPVDGCIETTFRCNLSCAHCYVNRSAADASARDHELPLERWLTLVDEIADAGCLALILTGGEPLLRPDFSDLYRHCLRRGLLVTLFTNGTLLDDRIAGLLDEERPEAVEITLYGATAPTYDRVTGVPGSHSRCLAGIRRLRSRGVRLRLKTMALTWNRHEIAAMRAFAADLGLEFRHDGLLNVRVDGAPSRVRDLQLGTDELAGADLDDARGAAELRAYCERWVPGQSGATADEHVFQCGAGRSSFAIDPSGRLLACLLSRQHGIDLRRTSFADGWSEIGSDLLTRVWQSESPCRSCNLTALCGSCPGAAELETGDLEGLVPQFCRAAHERAFLFAGEGCGHRRDAACCLSREPGSAR